MSEQPQEPILFVGETAHHFWMRLLAEMSAGERRALETLSISTEPDGAAVQAGLDRMQAHVREAELKATEVQASRRRNARRGGDLRAMMERLGAAPRKIGPWETPALVEQPESKEEALLWYGNYIDPERA